MYSVFTVLLAGQSPSIQCTHTVRANPSNGRHASHMLVKCAHTYTHTHTQHTHLKWAMCAMHHTSWSSVPTLLHTQLHWAMCAMRHTSQSSLPSHLNTLTHTHTHTYTHARTYIYTHKHVHTYTHKHTHMLTHRHDGPICQQLWWATQQFRWLPNGGWTHDGPANGTHGWPWNDEARQRHDNVPSS